MTRPQIQLDASKLADAVFDAIQNKMRSRIKSLMILDCTMLTRMFRD
jgi:hypothetical protein